MQKNEIKKDEILAFIKNNKQHILDKGFEFLFYTKLDVTITIETLDYREKGLLRIKEDSNIKVYVYSNDLETGETNFHDCLLQFVDTL